LVQQGPLGLQEGQVLVVYQEDQDQRAMQDQQDSRVIKALQEDRVYPDPLGLMESQEELDSQEAVVLLAHQV